jgi:hypothetical protein
MKNLFERLFKPSIEKINKEIYVSKINRVGLVFESLWRRSMTYPEYECMKLHDIIKTQNMKTDFTKKECDIIIIGAFRGGGTRRPNLMLQDSDVRYIRRKRKLGEVFQDGDVTLKVELGDKNAKSGCCGCYYNEGLLCINRKMELVGKCANRGKHDVIFVKQ